MTFADLATLPEIRVSTGTLMEWLFKPQAYVGVGEVVLSEDHENMHRDCGRGHPPPGLGRVCFYRSVLKIEAPGTGTVIYEVNAYDPEENVWIAAWPD